jgi:hypothetical protein
MRRSGRLCRITPLKTLVVPGWGLGDLPTIYMVPAQIYKL